MFVKVGELDRETEIKLTDLIIENKIPKEKLEEIISVVC